MQAKEASREAEELAESSDPDTNGCARAAGTVAGFDGIEPGPADGKTTRRDADRGRSARGAYCGYATARGVASARTGASTARRAGSQTDRGPGGAASQYVYNQRGAQTQRCGGAAGGGAVLVLSATLAMAEGDAGTVSVRFVSRLPEPVDLPESAFAVPETLTRKGLAEGINGLLQLDPPQPFDFLINEDFLRCSLATFLKNRHVRAREAFAAVRSRAWCWLGMFHQ